MIFFVTLSGVYWINRQISHESSSRRPRSPAASIYMRMYNLLPREKFLKIIGMNPMANIMTDWHGCVPPNRSNSVLKDHITVFIDSRLLEKSEECEPNNRQHDHICTSLYTFSVRTLLGPEAVTNSPILKGSCFSVGFLERHYNNETFV